MSASVILEVRRCIVDARRMTELDAHDEAVLAEVLEGIDETLSSVEHAATRIVIDDPFRPLDFLAALLNLAAFTLDSPAMQALLLGCREWVIENGGAA